MIQSPQAGFSEPQLPTPLTCASCGKRMRFVSAQPDTRYINLDQCNYVCDCGYSTLSLFVRDDKS